MADFTAASERLRRRAASAYEPPAESPWRKGLSTKNRSANMCGRAAPEPPQRPIRPDQPQRGPPTSAWSETGARFHHSARRFCWLPALCNSRLHLCFCQFKTPAHYTSDERESSDKFKFLTNQANTPKRRGPSRQAIYEIQRAFCRTGRTGRRTKPRDRISGSTRLSPARGL